ncbi:GNAT family N-acetyltransferase [Salinicoccus sp. HZC-1]|uniref:GNAT family N-acetyltransferase n=1 Tax=Salinicoccus sp. HZC-1 TaxID=3385497 RepID=UPI00398AABBB
MWHVKKFEDLDLHTLEEIYRLRVSVFIVEQACAYQEIDGKDSLSIHIYNTDETGIIAYLRIIQEDPVSIGRVIVREDHRGAGLGRALMDQAMDYVDLHHAGELIYLHGQAHLEKYYQSFGFKTVSAMHLEDDIPHYHMEYRKEE